MFKPAELIQANAGTGKTFSLTNRFLSLVNQGEKPDRILATTFTKKAAGEISERIFSNLAKAALDNEKAKELAGFIGDSKFDSERARDLLHELVEVQHRLNISTLDSFFYKVAMGFSLELGLAPGWNISDPDLEGNLRREAVRKVCKGENHKSIIKLLRMLDRGNIKRSVQAGIERLVGQGFDLLRETKGIDKAWKALERPALLEKNELQALISKLSEVELPKNKSGGINKNWQKAIAQAIKLAKESQWDAFIKVGLQAKIIAGEEAFYGIEISDLYLNIYKPLIQHATAAILKMIGEQTESAKRLAKTFSRRVF